MYDILNFTVADMVTFSRKLRNMGENADSMEEVTGKIVRHIYDSICSKDNENPLALVRLFATLPIGKLPCELQGFAENILGHKAKSPDMKCLTLLGSAGTRNEWNSRGMSAGHQAIPLESERLVNLFPMISGLVTQFGIKINEMLTPDLNPMMYDNMKTYNIFHVLDALNSPFFPAQEEFIVPEKICSVFSFGGVLASGGLFAVIIFARLRIPREVADMFRPLALSVKAAMLPYENKVFNLKGL